MEGSRLVAFPFPARSVFRIHPRRLRARETRKATRRPSFPVYSYEGTWARMVRRGEGEAQPTGMTPESFERRPSKARAHCGSTLTGRFDESIQERCSVGQATRGRGAGWKGEEDMRGDEMVERGGRELTQAPSTTTRTPYMLEARQGGRASEDR